jgi:hypothetical protein
MFSNIFKEKYERNNSKLNNKNSKLNRKNICKVIVIKFTKENNLKNYIKKLIFLCKKIFTNYFLN